MGYLVREVPIPENTYSLPSSRVFLRGGGSEKKEKRQMNSKLSARVDHLHFYGAYDFVIYGVWMFTLH